MTAMKRRPSRRAKYVSETAIEPLDFDDRHLRPDPAVTEAVEKQRTRKPVLKAARGVARLILEVKRDATHAGEGHSQRMGVGGAVEVGLDRIGDPRMAGEATNMDRYFPWPIPAAPLGAHTRGP
jgi:hypothetical protein